MFNNTIQNYRYKNYSAENLINIIKNSGERDKIKAGIKLCDTLIYLIKKDKTKVYGKRALKPLRTLKEKLKDENGVDGLISKKILVNNKNLINDIAHLIDNAENETLQRLAKNRTTQNSRILVKKSTKLNQNDPMFMMEGGTDYKKQTGNIIFTKKSNPVPIHEALNGLFDNPNIVYEVDYSNCTNQNIKNKMKGLSGTNTCYLRYDKDQKTYTIRDKEGKPISQRAYIWEGVKLIPAGVRRREAYSEEKAGQTFHDKWFTRSQNQAIKDFEKMLPYCNLSKDKKEALVKETERRIHYLLVQAKKMGYELHTNEPISKVSKLRKGHMELHLINGNSEVDRTIWEDDKILGSELYNWLGCGGADGYKDYLTSRVKAKRNKLSSLTKTEAVNVGSVKFLGKEIGGQKINKDQLLYGISQFEIMIDKYRETEGNSWIDNDDKRLIKIQQIFRNAKSSIENTNTLGAVNIINNVINPIWEERKHFKRITQPTEKENYAQLMKVFFGTQNEQLLAIRKLGGYGRLFDKTETSHVAEEIALSDDIQIKDPEINKCLDKIKKWTSMSTDNPEVRKRYDNTYSSAKKGTDSLITLFVGRGWLPKNWKKEEKEVRNCMDNLKNQLISIDKQCSNISTTVDSIVREQHQQRLMLEKKSNKTETDIETLQRLIYLEKHPEIASDIYKQSIEATKMKLKYSSLGQTVRGGLMSALGELGGGVVGKDGKMFSNEIADVFNDVKGYGVWNLSDENAKYWSEELITEIAIEVAVTAISIALAPTGAGEAIYVSFRVAKASAKGLKRASKLKKGASVFSKSLGKKIGNQYAAKFSVKSAKASRQLTKASHVATSTDKGIKGINVVRKTKDAYRTIRRTETFGSLAGKLTMKGTSMMIEGTAFHINSTLLHNVIEGKNLAEGLNPFGSTEYIDPETGEKKTMPNRKSYAQSIAFLGVLKTIGKPIQGLTGNMAKGILREKYDVNALAKMFRNGMSMTGEMGSMMATDQILSLTFDHKFKSVTGQELIHMFGMIAGLRLTHKVNVKIQEYDRKSVTLEMKQGDNTFNVKIDGEGNVLKIEGKDKDGNRIKDPQKVLGIKAGAEGYNIRENRSGLEVGAVKGKIRQLNNLNEGDVITVKRGESDVKFKKNRRGNREVEDAGKIESDWFKQGEEYVAKKNSDGTGYHLETVTEGGPRISLDGKVGVKLGNPVRRHSEYMYESGLAEVDQIELTEQFDKKLKGDGVEIDGKRYTMKVDGDTYTIYENGREVAKGEGKGSAIKGNSDANVDFLKRYNELRVEFMMAEEASIILSNEFYDALKSEGGITIGDITYKLKWEPYEGPNTEHKGRIIYTETNAKTGEELKRRRVKSDSFDIPTGSNGDPIRNRINQQKNEYVKKNYKSKYESIKSKVSEYRVETPIEDMREITKRGRYEMEMENAGIINRKYTDKFIESMGSELHEELRKGRLKEDGTYEPRIKETKDTEWISKNGTNQVDIANTKFEDLPRDLKNENLEAAKVAVDLVLEINSRGEKITREMVEKMSSKVHKERLKRNSWAKGGELDVPYDTLPEIEKAKDRNQVLQAIERVGGKEARKETLDSKYFNGKSHKFDLTEAYVRGNSDIMDEIRNEINEKNERKKLKQLRKEIAKQYKKATGKKLELTDEQLRSVLSAHKQKGKLGDIKLTELRLKNNILAETITDSKVRRFLLEAGFCGESNSDIYRGYKETSSFNVENSRWEAKELAKEIKSLNTQIESIENKRNERYPERKELKDRKERLEKQRKNAKTTAEKAKLDEQIKSIENEIEEFDKQHPQKAAQTRIKELESLKKSSEKRKESLEKAINFVETMNQKFDPKTLDAKNREKKEKSYEKVNEILSNTNDLLSRVSQKEKLLLELEQKKFELKEKEGSEKQQTETEIAKLENEIYEINVQIENILKTTYTGLRDLKGLNDAELMKLTHDYYEKVLKPIEFTVISPSKTFRAEIVGNDFVTQRTREILINGERLNKNNFETIRDRLTEMRLGDFESLKSMKDIETFIKENFPEGTAENEILTNLKKSLEENFDLKDKRLSEVDRSVIFSNSVSYMLDYMEAYPRKSLSELYEILDVNQNKIIHQHVQDKHFLTGSSHDVLHILRGNMNMAENFMRNMSPLERIITRQIIIDHDMGYTSLFNHILSGARSNVFFNATKDHPLRSTKFIEANKDWYVRNFGQKGYEIIRKSITGHSKPDTRNLPTAEARGSDILRSKQIDAVISVVDCVAASADYKSAFLFGRPEVSGRFMSVYTSMNEGRLSDAINELHGIVETTKSIKNENLRNSIMEALNSLHLIDPKTGTSTLDTEIRKIDNMDNEGLKKQKKKFIDKLLNPEKSKKALNLFCKANGKDMKLSDISLEKITDEQIKNYLKFDYINDRVSFPYKKYLSQYGVRVSRNAVGETMVGCDEFGTVNATFELAGKSFEILLEKGRNNFDLKGGSVADFALESFFKVCDDMNIDLRGNEQIKNLKKHVNERVKDHKNKSISEYLKEKFRGNEITIKGKNGEKITLKFDGNSYEGFDRIIEGINEINNKIDKLVSENLEKVKDNPEQLRTQTKQLSHDLIDLGQEIQKNYPELSIDKRNEISQDILKLSRAQDIEYKKITDEVDRLRSEFYFDMQEI